MMRLLQTRLLSWYSHNQRDLPWRNQSDPYKIWVSEAMLQQTQVNTVIPYYHRFLAKFPSVESLATAELAEVLKVWEGLGYYARARNMHQAAQEIVSKYGGQLPADAKTLKTLPGFGDYTAGAVASLAFGEAVPAVDGNVKRVLCRLFAIEDEIASRKARQKINALAANLAQSTPNPADWTQALMELGALLCTPTKPRCSLCPAAEGGLCQARNLGIADSLPVKRRKKALPHFDVAAGVIYKNGDRKQFLIAQRPAEGMLGGLWEFPGGKQEPGESLSQCLRREIQEELALDISVAEEITVVKQSFTHFKITLHAFAATIQAGTPQKIGVADWAWVSLDELRNYAFGRSDRKIIEQLAMNSE